MDPHPWFYAFVLIAVGFIFFASSNQSLDRNADMDTLKICEKCQGKLTLIGIADIQNLKTNNTHRNNQKNTNKESIDPMNVDNNTDNDNVNNNELEVSTASVNIYQPDYSMDYEYLLQSLNDEQRAQLQSGKKWYQFLVCQDCGTLYVKERNTYDRPPRLQQQPYIRRTISPSSLSSYYQDRNDPFMDNRPRTIIYVPTAGMSTGSASNRYRPSGVDRPSSSPPVSSSGFGGGSSEGGGAGSSY